MKNLIFFAVIIMIAALAPCKVVSQVDEHVLAEWLFEPPTNPGTLNPTYFDTVVVTGLTVVTPNIFPVGNGFTSGTSGQAADRALIRRGWPTSLSFDVGDHCAFALTVNPGNIIMVEGISLWISRSGSGPTIFHLRSSLDGFVTSLDSLVLTSEGTWTNWDFQLVSPGYVDGVTDLVFRLYGNGSSGSAGTVSIDSVRVYGTKITDFMLSAKAFLSGPFENDGIMNDSLRAQGLVPLNDPYIGGDSIHASVLATAGTDAIVDWIRVELRDALDPVIVSAVRSLLLQRDGDIVDLDGSSVPHFLTSDTSHHVVVRHRNHLGAMTATPIISGSMVDFTSPLTAMWGNEAMKNDGGVMMLWPGNTETLEPSKVSYTGTNNDRDPILVAIGGLVPTNMVVGYMPEDVNLDGAVKYTGTGNDRDLVLQTIGGNVPTLIRHEQVP